MVPKIKPPSLQSDEAASPWGKPAGVLPPQVPGEPPRGNGRRWFGRSSLASILFALAIIALWGGRAWQDLSSPAAWAYWKDLYVAPSLTSSVTQVDLNGRNVRALVVRGEIGAAAASWFREQLDAAKLSPDGVVLLSSPGGRLDQATIMGEVIRARGLATMVATADGQGRLRPAYCASACVLVFAGGKIREAFPGSRLGVHQFTTSLAKGAETQRDIVGDTQKTTAMILDYMTRMGVSPSILQAMSASRDIRWLTESEALDLNLATARYAGR